jgi:hypothetical protein
MKNGERSLAKLTSVDFEIEDHGIPIWNIRFEYDDGGCQGMGGYTAETSFMCRILRAVGVNAVSQLVGKSCWVTHTHTEILKIEPLHKKNGTPFLIEDWRKWVTERGAKVTPHELVTGKVA